MPSSPRTPKGNAPENKLSMRLSEYSVGVINAQTERMGKLNGAPVSRSQSIESLIAAGSLVWDAAERTGTWSVTAIVDAGERALLAEVAAATNATEDTK